MRYLTSEHYTLMDALVLKPVEYLSKLNFSESFSSHQVCLFCILGSSPIHNSLNSKIDSVVL